MVFSKYWDIFFKSYQNAPSIVLKRYRHMVDYAEEEVDYEPSPSRGRTFPSFEEFLE
jgi:hypothetical protein